MPLPPIAVEIAPSDSSPELRQVLLDACTRAVQETTCVESNAQSSATPVVVAIVSWRDANNVRLEVALRLERRWIVRDVTFGANDDPAERWRAAGLVIGTLASVVANGGPTAVESEAQPAPEVGSEQGVDSTAPPAETSPPPATTTPPPPPPPAAARPTTPSPAKTVAAQSTTHIRDTGERRKIAAEPLPPGWMELAGIFGSALDSGPWRAGGELAARAIIPTLPLFGSIGISVSTTLGRVTGVSALWTEMVAGLGYRYELDGPFCLQGRLEGIAQRFSVSIADGEQAPTSGDRWIVGARAGADVAWWTWKNVGFVLGGTASWNSGTTEVRLGGERVASSTPLSYAVRAGVAYAFY